LWSYVNSDIELMDLGAAVSNEWHIAYLYARNDGKVRLWWDGRLLFDGHAPLVNPFDGYAEWGSGSWQHDASTTVDFDWVAYGHPCNLPQLLSAVHDGNRVVLSWPTNAHGYFLQSASNLTSGQWSAVTNIPAIVNDRFSVTNEVTGPGKFFRLSQ
jgi:hypothetical protein